MTPHATKESNRQPGRNESDQKERSILERVSEEIGQERYARYLGAGARVSVSGSRVDVSAPSAFAARYIERRLGEAIRKAVLDELDNPGVDLRFTVQNSEAQSGKERGDASPAAPPPAPDRVRADAREARNLTNRGAQRFARTGGDRRASEGRFLLESFVVGRSNRLAHNAALRIAEQRDLGGASHLFLHGPCGVGKTHLLKGIATRCGQASPGCRIRYTTAEAFTNAFVQSIRNNQIEAFRKRHRALDLLCIDDVHFFSRKDQTQSELLFTLDALDLDGARLVLASDEHPTAIGKLNEALRSRFLAGAVVRLDPPEPDLRRRIVACMAERRGLSIEPGGVALIADGCGDRASARDLEGALARVEACHQLIADDPAQAVLGGGRAVSASAIRMAFETVPAPASSGRPVHAEEVLEAICQALAVPRAEVLGRSRHKKVVLARSVCVHLCRKLTTLSYPEIARAMSRPNHSTVITADKRIRSQIERGETITLEDRVLDLGVFVGDLASRVSTLRSART